MAQFDGKVAIVTGAGRGIGREIALLMAREGAKVVVNDLGGGPQGGGGDGSYAQTVADEIEAAGGAAVAETSSIASMAGGKALAEAAMDSFGRIDFVINNAGIIRPKRVWDMTEDDWDFVHNVNLKGYFSTVRHAAPHLMKRGGAIVNFSSPSGLGHVGMSNYSAAKEGVVGFTRSIARDFAEYSVRANAIRPVSGGSAMAIPEVYETISYSIETLKVPPISNLWLGGGGVDGLPEHVASVAAWLCTDKSAPLNGREIYICGGQVALVQEPELIRAQFNAKGWDLESLSSDGTSTALTFDQRNRFSGAP